MFRIMFTVVALGLGVAIAFPAAAEVEQPEENHEAASFAGTRVDETSGGFQLVTHGVWAAPAATVGPQLASQVTASGTPTAPQFPIAVPRESSFRRAAYLPQVFAAEVQLGLPTGLLDALIWTESRYNPTALSGAGAAGLGQLMPGTARELGITNRFDPQANVWGAARYLRQQLDRFRLVHLALAAYNAGPGAVERAGGVPRNGETPRYVSNVLSFWGKR